MQMYNPDATKRLFQQYSNQTQNRKCFVTVDKGQDIQKPEKENATNFNYIKQEMKKVKEFNGPSNQLLNQSTLSNLYATNKVKNVGMKRKDNYQTHAKQQLVSKEQISQLLNTHGHASINMTTSSEFNTTMPNQRATFNQMLWMKQESEKSQSRLRSNDSSRQTIAVLNKKLSKASVKTAGSSPERVVNIVCPSQKSTNQKSKSGKRIKNNAFMNKKVIYGSFGSAGRSSNHVIRQRRKSYGPTSSSNKRLFDNYGLRSFSKDAQKKTPQQIETPKKAHLLRKKSQQLSYGGNRSNSKSISRSKSFIRSPIDSFSNQVLRKLESRSSGKLLSEKKDQIKNQLIKFQKEMNIKKCVKMPSQKSRGRSSTRKRAERSASKSRKSSRSMRSNRSANSRKSKTSTYRKQQPIHIQNSSMFNNFQNHMQQDLITGRFKQDDRPTINTISSTSVHHNQAVPHKLNSALKKNSQFSLDLNNQNHKNGHSQIIPQAIYQKTHSSLSTSDYSKTTAAAAHQQQQQTLKNNTLRNKQQFSHSHTKSYNNTLYKQQEQQCHLQYRRQTDDDNNNARFKQGAMMQMSLTTDDYCETITCSSDNSPERRGRSGKSGAQRVLRAAKLTKDAYLRDIEGRVLEAELYAQEYKTFDQTQMLKAHRMINERQRDRLELYKQQMKESLRESQNLNCKLQGSITSGKHPNGTRGEKSEFNNLVLGFSEKVENMAQDFIEQTEKKARDMRLRSMIQVMKNARIARSRSKSVGQLSQRSFQNIDRLQDPTVTRDRSLSARSHKSTTMKSKKSSSKKQRSHQKSRKSSIASSNSLKSSNRSHSKKMKRKSDKSKKRSKSLKKKSGNKRKSVSAFSSQRARSKSRSCSKKKLQNIKKDIFKTTNGFTNFDILSNLSNNQKSQHRVKKVSSKLRSRSKSIPKSKSKSKPKSRGVSLSRELSQRSSSLFRKKYNVVPTPGFRVKRKTSSKANKQNSKTFQRECCTQVQSKPQLKQSKSRSKTPVKKLKTKVSKQSRSPGTSIVRRKSRSASKKKEKKSVQQHRQSWNETFGGDINSRSSMKTPPKLMMTPLNKILRNTMLNSTGNHYANLMKQGFSSSSMMTTPLPAKKVVQICTSRLQDITHLSSSSDSSSSCDSEDSLDNDKFIRRQAAACLSPWQQAVMRKVLPKNVR